MKKKNILNLIKYHFEDNDTAFRDEAYGIAAEFNRNGDGELAERILSYMTDRTAFVPQTDTYHSDFLVEAKPANRSLYLPDVIMEDLRGIIVAADYNRGVNRFLFEGSPGTGKTESVKQIAPILQRRVYTVNFDSLIDSRLGQTSKNIAELFEEINSMPRRESAIVLFDEIDALAMDRTNSRDLREMGRATTAVIRGLDNLNDSTLVIATTNLFSGFDRAFIRRFDKVVNFNRYTAEDLIFVAEKITDEMLKKFNMTGKNTRLLNKILSLMDPIPYPGELYNLIKTSVAFSDPNKEADYLSRMMKEIRPDLLTSPESLREAGFTLREMECLTHIPKTTLSRELSGGKS